MIETINKIVRTSRQMMMAWKVSGLSQSPAIMRTDRAEIVQRFLGVRGHDGGEAEKSQGGGSG